jgi:hypothetical protein
MLERLAIIKHSSFLGPFISYKENKVLRTGALFTTLRLMQARVLHWCGGAMSNALMSNEIISNVAYVAIL